MEESVPLRPPEPLPPVAPYSSPAGKLLVQDEACRNITRVAIGKTWIIFMLIGSTMLLDLTGA